MGLFDKLRNKFRHKHKEKEKKNSLSNESSNNENHNFENENNKSNIDISDNKIDENTNNVDKIISENETYVKENEDHDHDSVIADLDDQKQFIEDVNSQVDLKVKANDSCLESSYNYSLKNCSLSNLDDEHKNVQFQKDNVNNKSTSANEIVYSNDLYKNNDKNNKFESNNENINNNNDSSLNNQKQPNINKYDMGLKKTRHSFREKLSLFFSKFHSVNNDFFDNLEEIMIEADIGYDMTIKLTDSLRNEIKINKIKNKHDIEEKIVSKLVDIYGQESNSDDNLLHFSTNNSEPTVFLFVGVNGAGKTTTIGKLAYKYKNEGKKVLLAAGDTFRAGAIEQLKEWSDRTNTDIVYSEQGRDPASVVYDALQKAKKDNYDILLVDTAGRLQNKVNLMNELKKINKIIKREIQNAPHETLLVLDATVGQNALVQAKQFNEVTNVTGIVLTKVDGTAKGGIVLAIKNELNIPVKLIGLGEKVKDLENFNPSMFMYGLFKDFIIND